MTLRRKAREDALKILYQMEISCNFKLPVDWESFDMDFSNNKNPEAKDFTIKIVNGILQNFDFIDRLISKSSLKWKLDRMPLIDRNILRVASYELWFLPEIPVAVSINEAIEISKKYASENSPKFINGVLNHVKEELEKHEKKPA
ncbi:MAG: transcription antitermination factor NusB [Candidatus Omnitrophica bacterium]|nr:transcription antitermination factor NusB [Candidatus Omnitrophota bacterium]